MHVLSKYSCISLLNFERGRLWSKYLALLGNATFSTQQLGTSGGKALDVSALISVTV